MDQNELDFGVLDEAQYLLERMLERSAYDDCQDTTRAKLQKGFEVLQRLVGQAMERFHRERMTE